MATTFKTTCTLKEASQKFGFKSINIDYWESGKMSFHTDNDTVNGPVSDRCALDIADKNYSNLRMSSCTDEAGKDFFMVHMNRSEATPSETVSIQF